MNDLLTDARFWFTAMGVGLVGFVRYLWSQQEKRLAQLEADVVRRKEFDQLRGELREEHEENRDTLGEIKALIERNHQDAIDGRHDVRNQILGLVEKVGTIQGRLGLNEFRRRE